MPEILTESFCERCGTRYTFESAAPRAARLKGVRVLSRGLKNFVMSDDTSMDEAMAAARSETDREVTAHQLEAFHKTFNFCMTCRQYTCSSCWNEPEGRCLSCAPSESAEGLPAAFPGFEEAARLSLGLGPSGANGHPHDSSPPMAWPGSDLATQDASPPSADPFPTATAPVPFAWPTDDVDPAAGTPEPPGASQDAATPPPWSTPDFPAVDPADVAGRAAAAADRTQDLFGRFRPGQSLDDELAAYEDTMATEVAAAAADGAVTVPAVDAAEAARADAEIAAAATAEAARAEAEAAEAARAEAEAAEAARADAEIAEAARAEAEAAEAARADAEIAEAARADAEIAAAAAAVTAKAEIAAAARAAAARAAAEAEAAAAEADRVDIVEQPTWRIVAPETATPAAEPVPGDEASPAIPSDPQWPARPEWPSQRPAAGLPFLGRPTQPAGSLDSLWAESVREVTDAPAARPASGVAPCVSCGLSLSATARFCRRCGTRQG